MLLLTIVNNSHREYVLNQVKSMIDYLSNKKRSLNLRYDNDKLNQCIHIYLKRVITLNVKLRSYLTIIWLIFYMV